MIGDDLDLSGIIGGGGGSGCLYTIWQRLYMNVG